MGTLLLLAGPKGVGKSWVAQIAARDFAVHYVDADLLILDLVGKGFEPDREDGWLQPVQEAVFDALRRDAAVSIEITGAWDSDYKLARSVEARGHRVVRLLLFAPFPETLARLRKRASKKVPVSEAESRSIYFQAEERTRREHWDAWLDTSGGEQPEQAAAVLRQLLGEGGTVA